MSSKDRFQRRARHIQKETGWSYSECLRLSRAEITEEALALLIKMRHEPRTVRARDTLNEAGDGLGYLLPRTTPAGNK